MPATEPLKSWEKRGWDKPPHPEPNYALNIMNFAADHTTASIDDFGKWLRGKVEGKTFSVEDVKMAAAKAVSVFGADDHRTKCLAEVSGYKVPGKGSASKAGK